MAFLRKSGELRESIAAPPLGKAATPSRETELTVGIMRACLETQQLEGISRRIDGLEGHPLSEHPPATADAARRLQ